MNYQIIPIFLGSVMTDKGDSLFRHPHGEQMCTVYSCFVLKAENATILVDSGLPSQEDILANGKPFRQMPNAPDFITALRTADVDPDAIETAIITHLHYDHCCNLRFLKNLKKVYVQARELLYAVSPSSGDPNDLYYYALREDCGGPEWTDALGKFQVIDGDMDVLDGVKVLLTPGHSPGSQSVLIDTKEGKYMLTGDFISIFESYETKTPNAILNNEQEWYESYDKVAGYHAKLLPSHEVKIFDRKVYG